MTITRPMSRLSAGQDFQLGEDFQSAKIVSEDCSRAEIRKGGAF